MLHKIWEDWKKFASYAFNKSHATCYSWVAYQTAYLKAHYPAEYMAANMSRNFTNIVEITKLMDECKVMGIPTLGPDVNESRQKFSVNKAGAIRFGLAAIKGMGSAAAENIVNEREKNGPYASVFDFVQRVSLSACNKKCIETLVLSGGLDSMGIAREQYFAANAKGELFLDTLVRYGQLYQQEQLQAQNSLFGGCDAVEIATPPVPEAESWSTIERLNRERNLVGIYLSAHPLDDYEFILNNLCNTHCSELADRTLLSKKQEVVFGGIVTAVRSKFTKSGKPCGFVTIEDFEGSGELPLFGEEWGKWKGMLIEGCSVYVKVQFVQRFRNSDHLEMRVTDIQYLQTVKDSQIDRFTITIEASKLDDTIVADLATIVKDNPGATQLYFQVNDNNGSMPLQLYSKVGKIDINKRLIAMIKDSEALDYRVN